MISHPVVSDDGGWCAELELRLERQRGRTVVAARRHHGPLALQRAFYPEGELPHLYVLHPPGGIVGGDALSLFVHMKSAAQALITTPGAGKLYRSDGRRARIQQHMTLEPGATLEWMPQETLVFDGARADACTRVDLHGDSTFIGWEIQGLGRPAAAEAFLDGELRQRFEIHRDRRPLWIERARFRGGGRAMGARWGMASRPVAGTLVAVGTAQGLAARIREEVGTREDEAFAVTQLDDVLVCRFLGGQALRARDCLLRAWSCIRPALLGRDACRARIWNT